MEANTSLCFRDTLGVKSCRMALAEANNSRPGDEHGDSDVVLKASVLGGFGHIDETKALISSLPEVHGEMLTTELAAERFGGKAPPPRVIFLTPNACSWIITMLCSLPQG